MIIHDSIHLTSLAEQREVLYEHHINLLSATVVAWMFLCNTIVAARRWAEKSDNYIYVFYFFQSFFGLGLPATAYYMSVTSCHSIIYIGTVMFYLSELCAMFIILYKAYLISGRKGWLLVATSVIEVANILTIIWSISINSTARINGLCQFQVHIITPFAIRGFLGIIKNTILCTCLFVPVRRQKNSFKNSPLSRVVIRDGIIYLVVIALVSIVCSILLVTLYTTDPNFPSMLFILEALTHSILLRIQFIPRHISSLDI